MPRTRRALGKRRYLPLITVLVLLNGRTEIPDGIDPRSDGDGSRPGWFLVLVGDGSQLMLVINVGSAAAIRSASSYHVGAIVGYLPEGGGEIEDIASSIASCCSL